MAATFPLVRDIESIGETTDDCTVKGCDGEFHLVSPVGDYGQWWMVECDECGHEAEMRVE